MFRGTLVQNLWTVLGPFFGKLDKEKQAHTPRTTPRPLGSRTAMAMDAPALTRKHSCEHSAGLQSSKRPIS